MSPDSAISPFRRLFEVHVRRLQAGELEAIVGGYTADATLTTFDGVATGQAAIRAFYAAYLADSERGELISTDQFVEADDAFYVEATVRTRAGLAHVYDAFIVEGGLIVDEVAGVK